MTPRNKPAEPVRPRDRAGPLDLRRFSLRARLLVPTSRTALQSALRKVLALAVKCGCRGDARTDLEIAAREALANAMVHGNGESAGKKIFVGCYGDPGTGVLLVVRDQGPGFDPHTLPDPREGPRRHLPHGRGVFLMRELMDRVEYRSGGREVRLFKAVDGNAKPRRAPRGRPRSS